MSHAALKLPPMFSCVSRMELYIWSSRDVHIFTEPVQVYSKEHLVMDFKTTWRTEVMSHILEVKVKGDAISPVIFFFPI